MYVKYPMKSANDYRGQVKLVVRTEQGQEIAYSSVLSKDSDMVELIAEEVEMVKDKTNGQWNDLKSHYKQAIDRLADTARKSHKSSGTDTIDIEYYQVQKAIESWEQNGSDPNSAPIEVVVWAEAKDESIEWAVTDIKTAAAQYAYMIQEIRSIRLKAKADIDKDTSGASENIYNNAVANLHAIMDMV